MARKKGVITQADAADLREKTIKIGEEVKRKFADLIPHRIDNNTVILINSQRDKSEQINRFMAMLAKEPRLKKHHIKPMLVKEPRLKGWHIKAERYE